MLVTVDRIAAGGDGVGRLESGMVVFVPRTAPADQVDIEIVDTHKRHARGRLREVVVAGGDRVEAACVHYVRDECGGCQLQHLSYAAQLEVKRRIVGDALRRIGRVSIDDPPITPTPGTPFRYRTKISLAASGGRVGMRRYGRPDAVFALDRCEIADRRVTDLWGLVRPYTGLLPAKTSRVTLRLARGGSRHIVVEADDDAWDPSAFFGAVRCDDVSVWWRPLGGAPRVVAGPETGYPVLAFEQVNPPMARSIREAVVASLGDVVGATIWDLYGGVGETAVALAGAGATVWSVDADRAAVAWGERQAPHAKVTRLAGRAEDVFARLPEPDAVVVNPPRAGIGAPVSRELERWGAEQSGRRLRYVACDPATLARDITRLPSFRIQSLHAFDMFPQTSHVETFMAAVSV